MRPGVGSAMGAFVWSQYTAWPISALGRRFVDPVDRIPNTTILVLHGGFVRSGDRATAVA